MDHFLVVIDNGYGILLIQYGYKFCLISWLLLITETSITHSVTRVLFTLTEPEVKSLSQVIKHVFEMIS